MDIFDLLDDDRPDRQQYLLLEEDTSQFKDGYPTERFVNSPPQDYICVVCTGVVREPLECMNCGLLLCLRCVTRYLESRRRFVPGMRNSFSCPQCRHRGEPRTPSRVLTDIIGELQIYCKHRGEGCPETCTLRTAKQHQKTCQFRAARCVYCNVLGSKEEFLMDSEGEKRIYACSQSCRRTYEFRQLLRSQKREAAVKLYYDLLKESDA